MMRRHCMEAGKSKEWQKTVRKKRTVRKGPRRRTRGSRAACGAAWGRRAGEDTSRAESGEVTAAALGPVGAAADSKMHYVPSH